MRKIIQILLLFSVVFVANGQELNCLITINSDKISGSNKQVYKTLEASLTEFVNQKKWTNKNVKPQEKINCAFNIIVNTQTGSNRFDATLQVQAARPVYNSSYSTPILNIQDNDFSFKYNEFEQLNYNTTNFDSNLISTIVYYIYVILGVDADTFALNGGASYYKQAQNILLLAQQSGGSGWVDQAGKQNRYVLIDNLTSPKLRQFQNVLYSYHREGMDVFYSNKTKAKSTISNALISMQNLQNKTIGNYLIRLFFDAKSDEISKIFSDGSRVANSNQLQEVLQRISPTNNEKWQKIK